jgi:segregation and condensation protein B
MEKRMSAAAVRITKDDGPIPEEDGPEAPRPDHREALRIAEALLFASAAPMTVETLKGRLPEGAEVESILQDLASDYASRGVNLVQVAGGWAFRTASDLSFILARDVVEQKKLSRAAMETLAIVAYHQPVTRAEIEEIRGVATSKGTLDLLLETGWVRLRGRRRAPGRPVTYGTTPGFLDHFGLEAVDDLPGLEELKGAGFLEGRAASGLTVPVPSDSDALREDEDPLDSDDLFQPLDPAANEDAAPEDEAGGEEG